MAVAVLGGFGRHRDEQLPLARASFFILLVLGIPAWVVTLAFGSWTKSTEGWPDGIGWIDLGAGIVDAGLLFLLAGGALSYVWMRRPTPGGWAPAVLGIVSWLYVAALAVAWWCMSAKVPS